MYSTGAGCARAGPRVITFMSQHHQERRREAGRQEGKSENERERDGQTEDVLGSMFGWGMLCVCVVSYATNAKGGGRGLGLKRDEG